MKSILGSRGTAAVRGLFALAVAAFSAAAAQAQVATAQAPVARAVSASAGYIASNPAAFSTTAATIAQTPFAIASTLPLTALVAMNSVQAALDAETHCLAVAVYHEARGESLEGQLAVANVVINRARSDKYPPTWCEVVKQPWQFSFVNPRTGRYPAVAEGSHAWARAQAIARIAAANMAAEVDPDVLWYHADYVAPSWGRRLTRVEKIGTHIFYRA